MSDIKSNLQKIKKLINDAEEKSGRSAGSVKLMAVSKFHPQQAVRTTSFWRKPCSGSSSKVYSNTAIPSRGRASYNRAAADKQGKAGCADCLFHRFCRQA